MGVNGSKPSTEPQPPVDGGVYNALKHTGKISGGGPDIDVNNLPSLKNYENSTAGKTKENTIRKIANAMKGVGINVNPDDEDLDKIIRDLNKEIPNPKKGKTFAANAKTHAKVCRSVAKVLNDEFGGTLGHNFINLSGSPVEICRSVGEITHSLSQGVNTEFLGVIGSVKNSLHAINLMDQVMTNMYNMIQKHIKSADNDFVDREIRPLHDIYIKAKNEKDQKKMVLENLLHVHLEPASEALKHALDEHSRDAALIKKIGLTPGSSSMSDAIASTLTGVGTTSTIMNRAHKALKVVGQSMHNYINSHSFQEFEKKLSDIVEQGKLNPDQLSKFIEATEILKQGFNSRKQNVHGGTRQGGRRIKFSGEDEDDFGMPMQSSMRSRASRVIAKRSIINKDFVIRLDKHYNELLEAIMVICKELGKSIPLTSKTELLRDAMRHLQDHNGSAESDSITIEIVITHGIDTVQANEIKEQYINKLKMIANICDQISSMSVYKNTSSMFSKVKEIVLKIEKIIEYYSSTVIKNNNGLSDVGAYDSTYSKSINNPQNSTMDSNPSSSNSSSNDNDNDNDNDAIVGGSYDTPLNHEIDTPLIAKTGLTLNEIINTFNYYYYLASIRNNLKIYSKEYDIFGEDYNNMLGNSIAKRLYELERDYTIDVKKFINDFAEEGGSVPRDIKKHKDDVRKWIDNEYNIKIKFYKALQALELYLKEFTPAITSNIDAVKEIKTMLDETQVIARWYNESTGDLLINAFEQLPGVGVEDNTAAHPFYKIQYKDDSNVFYTQNTTSHYYNQIYETLNDDSGSKQFHFGDPIFGRSFSDYNKPENNIKNMKLNINDAIDHFQALKNIINTFIRIGNKFGNTDLSTKIFMSPSQIYKILFNYLKQSAMRVYIPKNNDDNLKNEILNTNNLYPATTVFEIHPYNVYFTGNANNLGDIGIKHSPQCLNNYEIEDKFFHLMIKAMAGKIMTVVGSYDMLEMVPPKHWITNTRLILGGNIRKKRGGDGIENPVSPEDTLEIIKEALPLYFKLPRLLEFYREILEFDMKNSTNISFLPDLDGIFTQLFLLIFRKSSTPDNGDYSDSELHKMVEEINNIYNYYVKQNTSDDIITSVIQDIVIDINRKYGLIKKDDYSTWVEMTKKNTTLNGIKINNTNYSILPDENAFEVNTMAPSDIYKSIVNDSVKIVDYDKNNDDKKTNLLTGKEYTPFSAETPSINDGSTIPHLDMLKKFREKLDTFFQNSKIQNMTSYTILVHQADDSIKRAKTNKEKISIVFQLIQSTGNLGLKDDKALLFNETIITGLNVLGAIEKLINNYSTELDNMDPFTIEKKCMNCLNKMILEYYGISNKYKQYEDLDSDKKYESFQITNPSGFSKSKPVGEFLKNIALMYDTDKNIPLYYSLYSDIVDTKYLIENEYINEPVFRGSPIFAKIKDMNLRTVGFVSCGDTIVEDTNNLYNNNRSLINDDFEILPNNYGVKYLNSHINNASSEKLLNNNASNMSSYQLSYNVLSITNIGNYLSKKINNDKKIVLFSNKLLHDNTYFCPSELIQKDDLMLNQTSLSLCNMRTIDPSLRTAHSSIYDENDLPIANTEDAELYLLYLRMMARISVNYQKIMETLLEKLFSLVVDSNGLIDLTFNRIENGKIKLQLNFKKLENTVNGIISDLKYYIEYFRPFMESSIINRFEKKENVGSIYDMEEKFNKLFNSTVDMYYENPLAKNNADSISKKTTDIFSNLTRDTLVSFDNLSNYEFINKDHMHLYLLENLSNKCNTKKDTNTPLNKYASLAAGGTIININYMNNIDSQYNKRFEWYGSTLSNLIFYDFSKKMPYNVVSDRDRLKSIPTNYDEEMNEKFCVYSDKSENVQRQASSGADSSPYKPLFYIYNAIALYNTNDPTFLDFNEYVQWSAYRESILPTEVIRQITTVIRQPGVRSKDDFNYGYIEDLDELSYPKYTSTTTNNYSYNMGIYNNKINEPIFPSNDINYKLNILIAKFPKDRDSNYRHLIQWPSASINSNQREYSRLPLYDNNCLYNDHNSLMFVFNQILSRYLSAFIDPSTGNKIYKNLLNSFVNGIASKITSSPDFGFPDMIRTGTMNTNEIEFVSGHNSVNNVNNSKKSMFFQKSLGLRGDIKEDSIIFQSLAYILQRISKDIDSRNNINIHLLNTLTDVPLYMKESYKANLPSFIKIFDFIIQKSEFFKNIIQKTNINLSRYNQCDFANFINSCTGLTDVRVNEVRYELHTYQVMYKYYIGQSIYCKINNNLNFVYSPAMNTYENIRTATIINTEIGRTPLNTATSDYTEISSVIPYIKSQDYSIDKIVDKRITNVDKVKISCTRGTRGYAMPLHTFPNKTSLIDGANNNSVFLKITDDNANKVNGFLSVEGLNYFTNKNENSEDFKIKLTSILDSIIAHSYTMVSCADEVLKELGDTPVYFETFDGSIEHYKARNNNDQLMPLSLSFWFLNNNRTLSSSIDEGPSHTLFGGYNLGTSNFKMLYGVRQLFGKNSAITFDQIPGVKTLLNHHNSSSSDNQIEESKYLQFINRLMTGLRFVVNIHGYKSIVAYDSNSSAQLVGDKNSNINDKTAVYALNGRPQKESILQILEDSYQDNSIKKICKVFSNSEMSSISRKDERMQVIIDSGINPINIHALMQDIPLANIYNYSYTFEAMTASMYGMPIANIDAPIEKIHPNKHTIHQFLKLLKDPFIHIPFLDFSISPLVAPNLLYNIFSGDTSLGMGRPKFLSDQLFNKCLLQNVNISPYESKQGPQQLDAAILPRVGGGNIYHIDQLVNLFLRISTFTKNNINAFLDKYMKSANKLIDKGTVIADITTEINKIISASSTAVTSARSSRTVPSAEDKKISALLPPDIISKLPYDIINIYYKHDILRQILAKLSSKPRLTVADAISAASAVINDLISNGKAKINNFITGIMINLKNTSRYTNENDISRVRDIVNPKDNFSYMGIKNSIGLVMSYLQNYDTSNINNNALKTYIYHDDLLGVNQKIDTSLLRDIISNIGYTRFNTNIVRNMFFISNILRIIRLQINREFTQNRNILKSSHFAISPSITEYGTMDPNEVYTSTYRGARAFNDEISGIDAYDEII